MAVGVTFIYIYIYKRNVTIYIDSEDKHYTRHKYVYSPCVDILIIKCVPTHIHYHGGPYPNHLDIPLLIFQRPAKHL